MNARTARIPWNHSSRSQGSSAGNLLPYRSAMITSFDDYPLHPGSRPINETNTADLNHYDRYFFNGYPVGGGLYFAAAMGLYPNRQVMDAAFCVVRGHRQTSVFSSGRAPSDPMGATAVGAIEVIIDEPLRRLRLTVDAAEHGVRAELSYVARSGAIEEPHFFQRAGTRVVFDYTRLTQFGHWTGWIELDGERIDLGDGAWGSRDRSWGIRPVGEPAPTGAPGRSAPQFFWLWAPVSFDGMATHFDVNEYGDGRRWHETGALAVDGEEPRMMRTVDYRVTWAPGTRWAEAFEYDLVDWNDEVHTVTLQPGEPFHMLGIGYGHPRFGHGVWNGELTTAGERLELPVADPCSRSNLHIQAQCAATYRGPDGSVRHGRGILEQIVVGPHPSGFTGIFDPFEG